MNGEIEKPTEAEAARRGQVDLVRIAGVQIVIDYSWIVIFLLVLWSLSFGYFPQRYPGEAWITYVLVGLAATVLFFASVLVHELSHALTANRLGHEVRRISLFIFGGMAHLSGEPRSPSAEMRIAAIGPLTSLALGALFWGIGMVLPGGTLWLGVFHYLSFINIALAVFNLLPGFPLDGGRLLRAYFWKRSGNLRAATSRAADWGSGIAMGLIVLGALQIFGGALVGGLWLIFIGMFLRGAARASYFGVVVEQALAHTRVRDLMIEHPVIIPPDTSVAEAVEEYFLRHGFGGFPVGSSEGVEGVLSLARVRACPPEERTRRRVRDMMEPVSDDVSIAADSMVSEALEKMVEHGRGRLIVSAGGAFRGLITHSGVARFIHVKTQLELEPAGA